ncbi:MAG: NADAR family protein, partial [Chloroflexota bacterium]
PVEIVLDGEPYPSVEHAFQAAKTHDPEERREIRANPSPVTAKYMGKRVALRPDWDNYRFTIMETLVRQKFTRSAELRAKLLATADAELIEGNTWRDTNWGAVWNEDKARWVGKNFLGQILMKIREELKEQ